MTMALEMDVAVGSVGSQLDATEAAGAFARELVGDWESLLRRLRRATPAASRQIISVMLEGAVGEERVTGIRAGGRAFNPAHCALGSVEVPLRWRSGQSVEVAGTQVLIQIARDYRARSIASLLERDAATTDVVYVDLERGSVAVEVLTLHRSEQLLPEVWVRNGVADAYRQMRHAMSSAAVEVCEASCDVAADVQERVSDWWARLRTACLSAFTSARTWRSRLWQFLRSRPLKPQKPVEEGVVPSWALEQVRTLELNASLDNFVSCAIRWSAIALQECDRLELGRQMTAKLRRLVHLAAWQFPPNVKPEVYRAHAAEILVRIARGESLVTPTRAELLYVLSHAGAQPSEQQQASFGLLFDEVFREYGRRVAYQLAREPWPGAVEQLLGVLRERFACPARGLVATLGAQDQLH